MKDKKRSLEMQMQILLRGHLLNPLWLPHDERRRKRKTVIADAKVKYLDVFEKEIKSMRPHHEEVYQDEQEHAFTLWLQGEKQAPAIVRSCVDSMRRHIDMPLVVLDEQTLPDWLELPDHIMRKWEEGKISRTHFSDICRIELLYRHGGIWADATDFFTSPVPEFVMSQDFFMFMAGSNMKLGGTHAFVQSCFMRIKKGNPLLDLWRQALYLYWEKEDKLLDYFTLHFLLRYLVENNECAAQLFSKMPKMSADPTHVLYWEYKDKTYSPDFYNKITEKTFFQKTTYKDQSAINPEKGSIAEYIINTADNE